MTQLFTQAGRFMRRNSTTILTIVGAAGVVATCAVGVTATVKAVRILDEAEALHEKGVYQEVTKLEAAKLIWKFYAPVVVIGGLTIAAIISSNRVSIKRSAAIASALTITDTAFREYRTTVAETVTPKKHAAIKDAIAKKQMTNNPDSSGAIILGGEQLCYDKIAGRYFKSDIETIRRVVNDLNATMMTDMYIALNDFYYALGLSQVNAGDILGWNSSQGTIEPTFSTQLSDSGKPCLVIDFLTEPISDYM